MKEKKTVPEKIMVIDIKLTRGLVVALSCVLVGVALLTYLTLTGERAAAYEAETVQAASTGMRQFYLTSSTFWMNQIPTACASGYHFASLWEMADPSSLKYNASLGHILADSSQGPPTNVFGWVRTGYASDSSSTPGKANCDNWANNASGYYGTRAGLPNDWTAGSQDVGVWVVGTASCNSGQRIWCIED